MKTENENVLFQVCNWDGGPKNLFARELHPHLQNRGAASASMSNIYRYTNEQTHVRNEENVIWKQGNSDIELGSDSDPRSICRLLAKVEYKTYEIEKSLKISGSMRW